MPRQQRERKLQRVQFDFDPVAVGELDRMMKLLGMTSRSEFLRFALGLTSVVSEAILAGGKLIIEDEGVRKEIIFPLCRCPKISPGNL